MKYVNEVNGTAKDELTNNTKIKGRETLGYMYVVIIRGTTYTYGGVKVDIDLLTIISLTNKPLV